jgi:drug/metabolite transporter (DMT)-like permease
MKRNGALLALHGAVLLFGFSGLFGKWLELPALLIVLGRTAVAAAALAAVRAASKDTAPAFDARLIVNGVLLALHWYAFFAAIQAANVAIGMLGYASFPLFVLILERLVLRRRWTGREALTALLVTAGLLLLVPELSLGSGPPGGRRRTSRSGRTSGRRRCSFRWHCWPGRCHRSAGAKSRCCWCWDSCARRSRTRFSSPRWAASARTRQA